MIIYRWMISITLLIGVLIHTGGLALAQSSPNYATKPYVISGGGYKTTSINYNLLSTVGQSSAIGISSSDSYLHYAGFWHTLRLSRMLFLPLILRE
jgi:hypothetical protein